MRKLSTCALLLVAAILWVSSGERDVAVTRAEAPTSASAQTQAASRLDQIILAAARAQGVAPASGVDDAAFLRRATVDLIGRIPTIKEYQRFMAEPAGSRRELLVDRLLDQPRFVDRWANFYGDMLRVREYDDGGSQLDDFLRQSLRDRRPYDEIVRELLQAYGSHQQYPQAGFIIANEADPFELAGVLTQTFMGVRMNCAQCHDHPFDIWTQREFYSVAAYFGETALYEREQPFRVKRIAHTRKAMVTWPPTPEPGERATAMTPKWPFDLASKDDAAIRQVVAARDEANRHATPSLDDTFAALNFDDDMGGGSGGIAIDLAEERAAMVKQAEEFNPAGRRIELANLVTDPRNRYFTWNIVNRVWDELIGQGIVQPVDDFRIDNPPSNEALIDHLAETFIADNYSLRELIRRIVLSDAYARQRMTDVDDAIRLRAESLFVAAPLRRMRAEMIYDSVIVAGHLEQPKHSPGTNMKSRVVTYRVDVDPQQTPSMNMGGDMAMAGNAAPAAANDMIATATASDADAAPTTQPATTQPATTQPAATPQPEPVKQAPAPPMPDARQERIDAQKVRQGIGSYTAEGEINFGYLTGGDAMMSDRVMHIGINELIPAETLQEEQRMVNEARREEMIKQGRIEYRQETEVYNDNAVYGSAYRMAAPAAPEHFLRQFGQTSRTLLGEHRDSSPNMRQSLIMLNGRLANEAANVGDLEPIATFLPAGHKLEPAVRLAYQEILTREPTDVEMKTARELITASPSKKEGMADLRWVLLNCHEFRYLP